jgi:periplasmic protein TonB
MEISQILTADFLDIVFDGKNKEYGAYELRKTYAQRLRVAITVTVSIVLMLIAGFVLANKTGTTVLTTIYIPDTKLVDIEPPREELIVPPPPAVKPPEMMERRHVEIVIVKDHLVPPDQEIPPVDELVNARISLVNKEGPEFSDIVPPVAEAREKGITALPKKGNEDSIFLSVQIQSQYPGGDPQWLRFLNRNLANAYPQEAADNGIQGKVVIQFIVDRDGNVSNVNAIAGPKELHEAAIKVIKKSGRWIPAEQNGRKVKSYKSQPIIFSLGDQ